MLDTYHKEMQVIEQKEKIIGLLSTLFPDIKITLFGSQARGDYTERSDIDLALDIGRKITILELAQLQNIIEALNIPQKVAARLLFVF